MLAQSLNQIVQAAQKAEEGNAKALTEQAAKANPLSGTKAIWEAPHGSSN